MGAYNIEGSYGISGEVEGYRYRFNPAEFHSVITYRRN